LAASLSLAAAGEGHGRCDFAQTQTDDRSTLTETSMDRNEKPGHEGRADRKYESKSGNQRTERA